MRDFMLFMLSFLVTILQMRRLADRLGVNYHVSPLRHRLEKLSRRYSLPDKTCIEDWLIAVAHHRGFRIIRKPAGFECLVEAPEIRDFSNEELVVAFCQSECIDEPQILRLPAQIISRKGLNIEELMLVARRERACRVLAELARQAVKVEPNHEHWALIHKYLNNEKPLSSPLLHWSRLAEPVMNNGRYNADKWVLVA